MVKHTKRDGSALQRGKGYTHIKDYDHKSVLGFEPVRPLRVPVQSGIWPALKKNFPRNKSTCPFPFSNGDDNNTTTTGLTAPQLWEE